MTAADGGYTSEMAVLRIFNKYFSLASGLLTQFGETCSSETSTHYLHWRYFHFLGEVTGSQIEPFAQIWSHFPLPWFCGLRNDTLICLGQVTPFQEDLCGPSHLCDTHMLPETGANRHLLATTWEKGQGTVPSSLFSGKMIYCLELQGQTFPGSRNLQQVFCGQNRTGCGQKPTGCGQKPVQVGWVVLFAAPAWSRLTACKDWHSNKEGTKYKAHKVFWAGMCRDIYDTGGVEQEGAVDDSKQFNWILAVWKDPLWQSASGPSVSSLGPFNYDSYLWTVFPLGAEQNSFNPSCFLLFSLFLFYTDFQKKYVFCS